MKNTLTGTYFHNDEAYNFNFATDLSAYNKTVFVRTVVDTLVDEYNYDSIIRDMIFDFTIIMLFTDIDTSFTKVKDDKGKEIPVLIPIEQFLEETNAVEIVKENMKVGLLEELGKAVDKSIEYRTGIHPSPIADSIAGLINILEKNVSGFDMDSAMGMVQKFVGMTDEFTPKSIVNAYIESDMHKQNLEEIAESKKNEIKIDENLGEVIRAVVEENKAEKTEE